MLKFIPSSFHSVLYIIPSNLIISHLLIWYVFAKSEQCFPTQNNQIKNYNRHISAMPVIIFYCYFLSLFLLSRTIDAGEQLYFFLNCRTK